ncbi:MAG TPA: hypothetical protein VFQ39_00870 [Longimicrobium sp.]|nr:hypothetical protein [Longimicrobium sp.]
MKKISLDVDALEVTSFAVDETAVRGRGTVLGRRGIIGVGGAGLGTGPVDSCDETCWRDTCDPCGAAAIGAQPAIR